MATCAACVMLLVRLQAHSAHSLPCPDATEPLRDTAPLLRACCPCRLRDDARSSPAVVSHLEAENAYTRAVLADTEGLQAALYSEMRARIKEEDASSPVRWGGRCWGLCCVAGAAVYCKCWRTL